MKTRGGFVSNSSSSSFVCAVDGCSYEGYDGEYEVPYACCQNGHEFNGDYVIPAKPEELTIDDMRTKLLNSTGDSKLQIAYKAAGDEDIQQWFEDEFGDIDEYEDYGDLPESACPICSFKYGHADHLLSYLMQKLDTNEEQLLHEIKEKFGTYKAFARSLTDRMKPRV